MGPKVVNILEGVQQFSSIVDIFVGGSQNLIASSIWGTVKLSLQVWFDCRRQLQKDTNNCLDRLKLLSTFR